MPFSERVNEGERLLVLVGRERRERLCLSMLRKTDGCSFYPTFQYQKDNRLSMFCLCKYRSICRRKTCIIILLNICSCNALENNYVGGIRSVLSHVCAVFTPQRPEEGAGSHGLKGDCETSYVLRIKTQILSSKGEKKQPVLLTAQPSLQPSS